MGHEGPNFEANGANLRCLRNENTEKGRNLLKNEGLSGDDGGIERGTIRGLRNEDRV